MKILYGDLIQLALEGQFSVIIHGCNCLNIMGAGIAKSIRSAFPEAYAADLKTVAGDPSKLGSISFARAERNDLSVIVVNGYTQFDWRGTGVKVNYEAIRSVMRRVKLQFGGETIGYPKIGAGLAGGDWGIIAAIIDEELAGEAHSLVLLK